ncbi:hypothetical protein B0T22DRAFT_122478 [Podospora appendiculata]|uniref:Uncharacterized protein n=1 Tax=Podospora appendiculata TaxID=314037 RepID=A0AAE1CB92_9PEZI|nr:hypothetical protein B0T22DRAFT_122478 [Podospora appendiculata]
MHCAEGACCLAHAIPRWGIDAPCSATMDAKGACAGLLSVLGPHLTRRSTFRAGCVPLGSSGCTCRDVFTCSSPWLVAERLTDYSANPESMEICEQGEIFVEKDDDIIFDHTIIILLDTTRIPADQIWPLANPNFTRAPDTLPPTSYLKRPRLLYYGLDDLDCGNQILTEVEACEVLKSYPHPSIALYGLYR